MKRKIKVLRKGDELINVSFSDTHQPNFVIKRAGDYYLYSVEIDGEHIPRLKVSWIITEGEDELEFAIKQVQNEDESSEINDPDDIETNEAKVRSF